MTNWIISGILGFVTGGVMTWLIKHWVQENIIYGAEAFAKKLHAKADAILNSVRK